MQCKSLWIKASAKCINVNVNVTLTYAATSEIAETPIENAELELFVDGSAQVIEGNRRAGYAVTSTTEVVASGRLPDHFSAQAAELVALTRA